MYAFFAPISKVQKDRRIIRETDLRMAKYSRRGLIINFLAFLVCLYGGRFVDENPELTIILTIGLLLITFVRGIFLFRFDQIYPRAPGKWRDYYFIATLAGACWWSVIMCSITLQLEMQKEAPLFWFYTIVFFSTTAHAFAPYQNFLSAYQLVGQMPAAIAAVYLGTMEAYLYAGILLGFYLVLNHQCRLMSENYWERLEVAYALTRKTVSLEEEKKDTRAVTRLNNDFLHFLVGEFREAVEDKSPSSSEKLRSIFKNTEEFQKIVSKKLQLNNTLFNIRHELQHIVAVFVDQAEKAGITIETSLSPSLPMRLNGDSKRLGDIVSNLIAMGLKRHTVGLILVEAEFIREYERAGELYITVSATNNTPKGLFQASRPSANEVVEENLQYVVSEGLADSMDGNIEKIDMPEQSVRYRFNAKIDIADLDGQVDFHRNYFSGHTILLVHSEAAIVDLKRHELEALGFTVVTETQYKRAASILLNSAKSASPIEAVLYYFEGDGATALEFSESLAKQNELNFVRQVIAVSENQKARIGTIPLLQQEQIFLVNKPMGLFELESTFHMVYKDFDRASDASLTMTGTFNSHCLVHCFSENTAGNRMVRDLLVEQGVEVKTFNNQQAVVESLVDKPDVILLDLLSSAEEIKQLTHSIRLTESGNHADTLVPILGVTVEARQTEVAFELGIDDNVDLRNRHKEAVNTIRYWATLH